jgi:hypothetical protein
MTFCKRLLAGLILLLCAAMLVASLTAAVGVWLVREPLTNKTTRLFGRAEATLHLAERSLEQVKASLARADERLASAREEQRKLAQAPERDRALRRRVARTAQQQIAPEVTNASDQLNTLAEAAVVMSSVLKDAESSPLLPASGADANELADLSGRLAQLGPAAWDLSRQLGQPGTEPDSGAAGTQMSRVESLLATWRQLIVELEARLANVRQRTADLQARTLPWITRGAVLISAVSLWIALSQVSLMSHAWSWWKRAGRAHEAVIRT